jgi:hypothetical protein
MHACRLWSAVLLLCGSNSVCHSSSCSRNQAATMPLHMLPGPQQSRDNIKGKYALGLRGVHKTAAVNKRRSMNFVSDGLPEV